MDFSPGYREWAPPAALAGSVTCLWTSILADSGGRAPAGGPGARDLLTGASGPAGSRRPRGPASGAATPLATLVLPDGCVDMIWQSGRGLFVAGPDTGPAPAAMPAGTVLIGVRFGPGAGGPALRTPLRALLDQRVDVADLGSELGRDLARAVPGSLPPELALRKLAQAAAALVAEGPADRQVAAAARLLNRPRAAVADVAARVGLGERQLRRRCEAAVGYGPATLRRVLRFRRFVSWVDDGEENGHGLAGVAAEAGYADQAHLTRDCLEFAGISPAALLATRRTAQP